MRANIITVAPTGADINFAVLAHAACGYMYEYISRRRSSGLLFTYTRSRGLLPLVLLNRRKLLKTLDFEFTEYIFLLTARASYGNAKQRNNGGKTTNTNYLKSESINMFGPLLLRGRFSPQVSQKSKSVLQHLAF